MTHDSQDCKTESRTCFETCGTPFHGMYTDNVIDILSNNIEDELICKQACHLESKCNFYTYYNELDPNYPSMCILLSELHEPFKSCDFCSTGPQDC